MWIDEAERRQMKGLIEKLPLNLTTIRLKDLWDKISRKASKTYLNTINERLYDGEKDYLRKLEESKEKPSLYYLYQNGLKKINIGIKDGWYYVYTTGFDKMYTKVKPEKPLEKVYTKLDRLRTWKKIGYWKNLSTAIEVYEEILRNELLESYIY